MNKNVRAPLKYFCRSLVCIVALIASAATAMASANVSCQIDDANLSFELEAIAGRAGPINQVNFGTIEIKPAAMKLASPKFTIDQPSIVQQWHHDGDMRLQFEVFDEPAKVGVLLTIFAQLNKKTDKYSGRYLLRVSAGSETKNLKGRIKECEAG